MLDFIISYVPRTFADTMSFVAHLAVAIGYGMEATMEAVAVVRERRRASRRNRH